MPKKIDMTGWVMKNHGVPNSKWTVLEEREKHGQQKYWLCQCECGTIKEVQGGHLRSGASTNCGCVNKSRWIQQNHDRYVPIPVGTRFGKLTVIKEGGLQFDDTSGCQRGTSLCQCDCGSEPRLYFNNRLKKGNIKSCGCLRSWGETYIAKILTENNISYQQEYSFENCKNEKGNNYRFDFAVFDQEKLIYLIEFDGKQHFEGGKNNWGYTLEEAQIADYNKNIYCLTHNIILKRIPYKEINNLNIEIIQSDKYNIT